MADDVFSLAPDNPPMTIECARLRDALIHLIAAAEAALACLCALPAARGTPRYQARKRLVDALAKDREAL